METTGRRRVSGSVFVSSTLELTVTSSCLYSRKHAVDNVGRRRSLVVVCMTRVCAQKRGTLRSMCRRRRRLQGCLHSCVRSPRQTFKAVHTLVRTIIVHCVDLPLAGVSTDFVICSYRRCRRYAEVPRRRSRALSIDYVICCTVLRGGVRLGCAASSCSTALPCELLRLCLDVTTIK